MDVLQWLSINKDKRKQIIKDFQEKCCKTCKSYFACGGERVGPNGCLEFERYIKDIKL